MLSAYLVDLGADFDLFENTDYLALLNLDFFTYRLRREYSLLLGGSGFQGDFNATGGRTG